MSIRHTGVSPATRKHLQLIEFIWHEPPQSAILFNDMLRPAGTTTAFSSQNGSTRLIQSIRERHRSFGIRVFISVASGSLLLFTTLKVFP